MAEEIVIVGIILKDREALAEPVNDILHRHAACIKGRLGLPGATSDVDVISVVMHANDAIADEIEDALSALDGVTCKTVRADI